MSGIGTDYEQPAEWELDPDGGDPYLGVPLTAELVEAGQVGDVGEPVANRLRPRLLTRDRLATLPEPAPLVEGTLDLGTVAMLAGPWGSCKTFIGLDWSACIASGRPWMGRPVKAGRVLYVSTEGAHGLHQRLSAWEVAWRTEVPASELLVLPLAVPLGSQAAVVELAALVADEGVRFVVLDTLSKCATGLDENSAKDMSRVVDSLYRVREATAGGTVLALHHVGKDGRTVRGSSAIEAGVDTVYQTEGDTRCLKLSRTKRRDGPTPDELTLQLSTPEHCPGPVILSARGADMSPTQDHLLSAFVSAFEATGASKAELRGVADMAPATFHRALSALVKAGSLVNVGTEQRPFYRLGGEG